MADSRAAQSVQSEAPAVSLDGVTLPVSLTVWVLERFENAVRIAGEKTGADRDGWLEDARYFQLILDRIARETQ